MGVWGLERIFSRLKGVDMRGRLSTAKAGCPKGLEAGEVAVKGFKKTSMRVLMLVILLRQSVDTWLQAAPDGRSRSVNIAFLRSGKEDVKIDNSQKANVWPSLTHRPGKEGQYYLWNFLS